MQRGYFQVLLLGPFPIRARGCAFICLATWESRQGANKSQYLKRQGLVG